MHNFLDESFHINALKELRVGTKVKYPRLAIIFASLVFCEVVQISSEENNENGEETNEAGLDNIDAGDVDPVARE